MEKDEISAYPNKKEREIQEKRKSLLGSLVAMVEDDDLPEDLARNHDRYLYGDDIMQ